MELIAQKKVDATGLICPEPIMLLHNAVRDSQVGDLIEIIATDPSTKRDVPNFCEFLQHELVHQGEHEEKWVYYVRKA